LCFIAISRLKKTQLLICFNALSDNVEPEVLTHIYNGAHDANLIGNRSDLTDKRLVDFQGIER